MIAAQKHGVERIVYTGSISAMHNFREIPQVINETHWNDLTLPKLSAYDVSKTLAELAAWDFIKEIKDGEHKPELVSILPGFTTGKIIGKGASSSVDIIKFLMRGAMSKVPRLEMKCVDVHDVAQAHVRSLFIPEAAGHRFILVDRPVWLQEIAQTLAEHYDGKEQPKLPIPTKEYSLIEMWIGSWFSAPAAAAYSYWNKQHNFDTSPSKIILGIEYARHPKECFLETANDFITSGAVRIN